jgi:hypothetical protein
LKHVPSCFDSFFECAGLALLLLLMLRSYSSPAAAAASFSRSYILRLRLMIFPQPRKRKLACVWRCQDGCQPFARLSNNHVVNRYRAHRNSEKDALPLTRVEFITFVLVSSIVLCVCVCVCVYAEGFTVFFLYFEWVLGSFLFSITEEAILGVVWNRWK